MTVSCFCAGIIIRDSCTRTSKEFKMNSTQEIFLKTKLVQLECCFTWALRKEDTDLSDLLSRLEDQIELDLGKEVGVARSYSILAFVKYLLGFSQEALTYLLKSEQLTREHHGEDCEKLLIVTYGDLAWLHYHMKDHAKCESYLEKLKEITDKFPTGSTSVLHPEVLGEKAWTFLKFSRKYLDRAKECFRQALELEPEESEWNAGYAIALYRTETECFEKRSSSGDSPAIKQLRRAIEMNPEDAVLVVLLGLRLAVYEEFEGAEDLVERALEMSPDSPHVMRYVGKFFRHQGSVDRSIALLKRALDRMASSAFIHHQLALCYKRKKIDLQVNSTRERSHGRSHHSKASEIQQLLRQCIHHLEMAITLKPSFIFAMAELALHYGEAKDVSRAEELFQTTFQTAKEKKENLQSINLYYGQFQQYSNRCEPLAIKHYMECLKLGGDMPAGKRSAENLRKIAEGRISRNPNDGDAFGILGFIHKAKGEKRQAIECYEKALQHTDDEEYLTALCDLRLSLQ